MEISLNKPVLFIPFWLIADFVSPDAFMSTFQPVSIRAAPIPIPTAPLPYIKALIINISPIGL